MSHLLQLQSIISDPLDSSATCAAEGVCLDKQVFFFLQERIGLLRSIMLVEFVLI